MLTLFIKHFDEFDKQIQIQKPNFFMLILKTLVFEKSK